MLTTSAVQTIRSKDLLHQEAAWSQKIVFGSTFTRFNVFQQSEVLVRTDQHTELHPQTDRGPSTEPWGSSHGGMTSDKWDVSLTWSMQIRADLEATAEAGGASARPDWTTSWGKLPLRIKFDCSCSGSESADSWGISDNLNWMLQKAVWLFRNQTYFLQNEAVTLQDLRMFVSSLIPRLVCKVLSG